MSTEIRVPALGESVTEATIAQWFKQPGEAVAMDEPICELETDKVTLEVPAPVAGVLTELSVQVEDVVEVGALLGLIDEAAQATATPSKSAAAPATSDPAPAATAQPAAAATAAPASAPAPAPQPAPAAAAQLAPSVRKLVAENDLDPATIPASGKAGRLTKGDVLSQLEKVAREAPSVGAPATARAPAPAPAGQEEREERVRMTRLRKTIAQRLKDAQNTAAMLTTFNEVDMTEVMALRNRFKKDFEEKHGVRLGFMSFFVKAAIQALREIPAVNAEIDGDELVYKNYYNIGVAVGTDMGLVVPVVRDADQLGFAALEKTINELGARARDKKLGLDDLQGGTFTISNGGVYGSLMSTPILNPPQSGILGMHKIQERPMAVDGKIEIRPMMYLALSYDHRIIDGKEAVTFLVRMKDCLEDPQRLLLDL